MRRRNFVLSIIVVTAGLQGCSSMVPTGTSALIDSLTSQLGVTPQQATGGLGSMLGYAKSQLSPSDFSTVAKALPGADSYIKMASDALGGGSINSASLLSSSFTRLGMNPGMVSKFAPIVGDYVGKQGGAAAKGLLAGLFK